VAEFRDRLAVNKQTTHKVHMERFDLKKLNKVEGKEQYRVQISNEVAALGNLHAEVVINRAYGTIRENIKISAKESIGYYKLKKNKIMVRRRMLRIIRSEETSQIAVVTGSSEINGGVLTI
jgi:hypothetical protein